MRLEECIAEKKEFILDVLRIIAPKLDGIMPDFGPKSLMIVKVINATNELIALESQAANPAEESGLFATEAAKGGFDVH